MSDSVLIWSGMPRDISNKMLAEEVVQDAFLYLMTSLPELDNEVGVLKFLKWKIRLLSLDTLRSSAVKKEVLTPDSFEGVAESADFVADYERAEDAAIIRLALAKLSPRHREALIANVYEERSTADLAKQMNLSENATRQLLLRARGAFRRALVGEAETSGKSVSQILAIAAKKTATDVRENALKVGITSLALVLGFSLPILLPSDIEQTVADSAVDREISSPSGNSTDDLATSGVENLQSEVQSSLGSDGISEEDSLANKQFQQQDVNYEALENTAFPEAEEPESQPADFLPAIPVEDPMDPLSPWDDKSFETILTTNVAQAGFYQGTRSDLAGELLQGETIEVFGGTGISAFIEFQPGAFEVRSVLFQMNVAGKDYLGVPANIGMEKIRSGPHNILKITAYDFYLVDGRGFVISDSPIAAATATLSVDLDNSSNPTAASLLFLDPSSTS